MTDRPVRLGVVGAGAFADFIVAAVADLPSVRVDAIADLDVDAAERLAATHEAVVRTWPELLATDEVDAVVVATPPVSHAALAIDALRAGKHVFCEKPLATTLQDATAVREAVTASGRVLVVDHVLRYNPILRLIGRLHTDGLLGPVQRFLFENDASDEDLPAGHWFWDPAKSGGILVEHGVHFFDAAAALLNSAAATVQAMGATRPDGDAAGVKDLVVATAAHAGGALATFAHGFNHPDRCERQLLHIDFGTAEARVDGWIPIAAELDVWTGDAGVELALQLPNRVGQLLGVPGYRPTGTEKVDVSVTRDAAPAAARGRGHDRVLPHHVSITVDIGGAKAKQHVYAESVRAAMHDLAQCISSDGRPVADLESGWAAVATAVAGTEAMRTGRTVQVPQLSNS